jgi:fumarylacetoacetase
MQSWLNIPSDSDFTLYNIPFGIFQASGRHPRAATRIGDYVIDLYELCLAGLLTVEGLKAESLHHKDLNEFISCGKAVTSGVRKKIQELFSVGNNVVKDHPVLYKEVLFELNKVQLLLPVTVGDYTDFYSSIDHATNVGSMFRPDNPLLPNWKNLPVAYHGRSSSIVLSGTPVKRPKGQYLPAGTDKPVFGSSQLLDYELEVAFVIGKESKLGEPIDVIKAEDYVFGFVLFNDWSARDIQSWEYQPLGPFLSKNFLSSISPWIVTLEALEPFRVDGPMQEGEVFPYLRSTGLKNFDLQLEVYLEREGMKPFRLTNSNFKYMYWNFCQQLAHHTVNGCNVRVGDMMASGTISGPTKESRGCMLELTWRGKEPIKLPDGSEIKFIADNDTIVMKGFGVKNGIRVGFGEVRGKVVG